MSSAPHLFRRTFIKRMLLGTAAALGIGGTAYSLKRGIRYPTLSLEPHSLNQTGKSADGNVTAYSDDTIFCPHKSAYALNLRAFSPEPSVTISAASNTQATVFINNISPDAQLSSQYSAGNTTELIDKANSESIDGISRTVSLNIKAGESITLTWKLPYSSEFTFASIGDSGGDKELAWCIQRAHDLGAKFLLHLGDFNYQAGDYQRSIDLFRNSPIPCYVSIGNHDFHDEGNIYPRFLNEIGPLNHAFTIGKTRFVNLDTAANMVPYSGGLRGDLIESLIPLNATVADTVAFTHRPLHDPLEGSTHDIGSTGERDWLISALKSIRAKTLLSGHIHIYDRSDFDGIDNIIAGQGLGHQDLITQTDVSKIVIGHVNKNGQVSYSTQPLAMPMQWHCHPRVDMVKESLLASDPDRYAKFIEQINTDCKTAL